MNLEKYENGEWKELAMLDSFDAWMDAAWPVIHGETYSDSWGDEYGALPAGRYRVLKPIYCLKEVEGYKEFMLGAEFVLD